MTGSTPACAAAMTAMMTVSVTPVPGQRVAVDHPEPLKAEQPERQLEGEPDAEHREDLERVVGLGLNEHVEIGVVVALKEMDRGRQHDQIGEGHSGEEQNRGDRPSAAPRRAARAD